MKARILWIGMLTFVIVIMNFTPIVASEKEVYYSKQVAVLVYHHLDPDVQGSVTITPKLFERQLEALQRDGFMFISFDQFKRFKTQGADVPDNAVLVTFDDGYESFATYAYPVLKKMRIPAVNFVITKDLDDPTAPKLHALSKEEIKRIRSDFPKIEFQGHSDSLHQMQDGRPFLTNKLVSQGVPETEDQFKSRISQDTLTMITKLTELNAAREVNGYAYPYGSYDAQTIALLQQAGIKFGFTTTNGITDFAGDPMQIPRINAGSPYIRPYSICNLIKRAARNEGNNPQAARHFHAS
ncbi:polysaccharide deacetylase family protein [Paenibacillus ferrarius]|uniref:polysaccharide deacetylase family protein n=1 Tax=Paenibacillus ferrarius TaxID=1469647 RepID=UPI003D27DA84